MKFEHSVRVEVQRKGKIEGVGWQIGLASRINRTRGVVGTVEGTTSDYGQTKEEGEEMGYRLCLS